jgi:hypothetical protein|tara:strand:- start:4050 stop:4322 length:273 start_codon:yes stop_codon:yes gene_type:complete
MPGRKYARKVNKVKSRTTTGQTNKTKSSNITSKQATSIKRDAVRAGQTAARKAKKGKKLASAAARGGRTDLKSSATAAMNRLKDSKKKKK